jgi:hypothetical protein
LDEDVVIGRQLRLSSGLGSWLLALFNQLGNALTQLCALINPVLNALVINAQTLFLATGHGVEETNTLNIAAVTGAAAVGYGQVVKRTLFGAAT